MSLRVFVALCLWTGFIATLVVAAGDEVQIPVRELLRLRLSAVTTPSPTFTRVLVLTAHNLPIAGWPIFLPAAGGSRSPRACIVGDALVMGSLAANVALVGAAFGAYGIRVAVFAPQLPVEWAALALGASTWLVRPAASAGYYRPILVALFVSVFASASIETYAVPHRSRLSVIRTVPIKRPFGAGARLPPAQGTTQRRVAATLRTGRLEDSRSHPRGRLLANVTSARHQHVSVDGAEKR